MTNTEIPFMGQHLNRYCLYEKTPRNYVLDHCLTADGEQVLWYKYYDPSNGVCVVGLDEPAQQHLFSYVGTDLHDAGFEHALQSVFEGISPEKAAKIFRSFCDKLTPLGIPPHLAHNRRTDPNVLLADRHMLSPILSDSRFEHTLFELIMNAVQEFQIGQATDIYVKVDGDTYTVSDNGSGLAVETSERFRDYEWQRLLLYPRLVYDYPELLAEGLSPEDHLTLLDSPFERADYYKPCPKYDYKSALPKSKRAPGDTLAHIQCAAESMTVTTVRQGVTYRLAFRYGYCLSGRQIPPDASLPKGTVIEWKPDPCCFDTTQLTAQSIADFLKMQAILNPTLAITLDNQGDITRFCYPGGLVDYVRERQSDPLWLPEHKRIVLTSQTAPSPANQEQIDICMCIDTNPIAFTDSFHNYRRMKGGSTADPIYPFLTAWLNDFSLRRFPPGDPDKPTLVFTEEEVRSRITVVVSSFSEYSSYSNGAQNSLSHPLFEAILTDTLREMLSRLLNRLIPDICYTVLSNVFFA